MTTKEHIENYAAGSRRGKQANRLEREALNDPFLSDALEGFEEPGNHRANIEELKRRNGLQAVRHRLLYPMVAAAAGVALLLTTTTIFLVNRSSAGLHDAELLAEAPESVEQPIAPLFDYYPKEAVLSPELAGKNEIPIALVDEKPAFKKGDVDAFTRWVENRLRNAECPDDNGIPVKAIVEFVVTAEGRVTEVKIIRGLDLNIDAKIMDILSNAPKWTPGKQDNQPVDVKCVMPVVIRMC